MPPLKVPSYGRVALALCLAACGNGAPSRPTGAAGSNGAAGVGGEAGASGAAGAGAAGVGAGGATGAAGAPSGVAGAGEAGSPGAAGTGATADGGAGATGAAGAVADGGVAYHRFVCPAGPYPAEMAVAGTTKAICNTGGFQYNYGYNEGPTWIASQNAFFFSNFVQGDSSANKSAGDIIKYTLGGDCEVWLHDVGCNGLGVASDGNLLGACHGPRAVMKYDVVTKQGTMLATMAGGQMLDAPNDLISTSNNNIYFSNTTYELGGRPQGLGFALVRIDPLGVTSVVLKGNLNGMALSPDERTLYVVGMGVWTLNADGSPDMKTNQGGPGGDGIAMDCAGDIVNANSSFGTNAAFGGPDGKTLIAVGGGTSAKIMQMTVPGFP
jgi:gluconolactonase